MKNKMTVDLMRRRALLMTLSITSLVCAQNQNYSQIYCADQASSTILKDPYFYSIAHSIIKGTKTTVSIFKSITLPFFRLQWIGSREERRPSMTIS
jgi:hypothetical protein